jgi:hypothetical protein
MICSSKEREIEELIQELAEVRPSKLLPDALRLFNTIIAILDERTGLKREIEELKTQKDYYKARHLEFNAGMIEGMKTIEKNDKRCLHCGSNKPSYCEKCFQNLIGQNAKLQMQNAKLQIEQHIPRID